MSNQQAVQVRPCPSGASASVFRKDFISTDVRLMTVVKTFWGPELWWNTGSKREFSPGYLTDHWSRVKTGVSGSAPAFRQEGEMHQVLEPSCSSASETAHNRPLHSPSLQAGGHSGHWMWGGREGLLVQLASSKGHGWV